MIENMINLDKLGNKKPVSLILEVKLNLEQKPELVEILGIPAYFVTYQSLQNKMFALGSG